PTLFRSGLLCPAKLACKVGSAPSAVASSANRAGSIAAAGTGSSTAGSAVLDSAATGSLEVSVTLGCGSSIGSAVSAATASSARCSAAGAVFSSASTASCLGSSACSSVSAGVVSTGLVGSVLGSDFLRPNHENKPFLAGFSAAASFCCSSGDWESALSAGRFEFLSSPEPNIEKGYLSYITTLACIFKSKYANLVVN